MRSEQFVVAVRRESRDQIRPDWVEFVRHTDGVQNAVGNDRRLVVQASPEAMQHIEGVLGQYLFIERVIAHYA